MDTEFETGQELQKDVAGFRRGRGGLWAVALGATAGLAFYFLVGCQSGACILTSTWWSSTLYGALMGPLVRSAWS